MSARNDQDWKLNRRAARVVRNAVAGRAFGPTLTAVTKGACRIAARELKADGVVRTIKEAEQTLYDLAQNVIGAKVLRRVERDGEPRPHAIQWERQDLQIHWHINHNPVPLREWQEAKELKRREQLRSDRLARRAKKESDWEQIWGEVTSGAKRIVVDDPRGARLRALGIRYERQILTWERNRFGAKPVYGGYIVDRMGAVRFFVDRYLRRAEERKRARNEQTLSTGERIRRAEVKAARKLGIRVAVYRALSESQRDGLQEGMKSGGRAAVRDILKAFELKETNPAFFTYAEFFRAPAKRRRITFLSGPTNSGKTHQALNTLGQAGRGCYLAPLRLMALEGQESLTARGVRCSLVTGEERDLVPGATHVSSTIEMLDTERPFDVAVIDEVQMVCDADRGWAWPRALFGVNAPHVVLTGDPLVEPLVARLAIEANAALEVKHRERKAPLEMSAKPLGSVTRAPDRSAIIAFSRRDVHRIRNSMHRLGRPAAVIYGALSPQARRGEERRFREGDARVVVATDAIGMGLNLPIEQLFFWSTEKYDGIRMRRLTASEVRQISGRAGRFGLCETGFVGGFKAADHEYVRRCLQESSDEPGQFDSAWAGPAFEHIRVLGKFLGTNDLPRILDFFRERITFSSADLTLARLADTMSNARFVQRHRPRLPLEDKWRLAIAPVTADRKARAERDTYEAIVEAVGDGRSIGIWEACGQPPLGSDLRSLEIFVAQLTIYVWASFRFPDHLPEGEGGDHLRQVANERISGLLASQSAMP